MKKNPTRLLKMVFHWLLFLLPAITASSQTTLYFNGTGALNSTSSWGINTDGTGGNTGITDFTGNSFSYIIQNTTSITFNTGTWTVSGTGTKVYMGNPNNSSPAITLTIAPGNTINTAGQLFDVPAPSSGAHKIVYQNTTPISVGTVDANLDLVFDGAAITTTSSRTYGNVSFINGANVDWTGATNGPTFNNLTIDATSTLVGPVGGSNTWIAIKSTGVVTINGTLKAGRTGGLYTANVAFPVVNTTTYGTLLFNSATVTQGINLILGSSSTIDYYRGATGQVGAQTVQPLAYGNLTFSNASLASSKTYGTGDFTVSGTFTVNLLGGSSITAPTTQNITLLPGAKLLISSATAFPAPTGSGKFTLQSDGSGTASIGTCASGSSITGNVTVQQYIPAGFRKYRFLSHPFTTALPLSQLTDNIDITGNTAGTTNAGGQTVGSGFTSTTTNNPSAYYFNTATADGGSPNDGGWKAFLDATTGSWAKAQGIRVLIRGTKGQTGTLDGSNTAPNAVTLDMTGTVNTGDVVVNLVTGGTGSTAGFNMVGNPYPSPVNVGAVLTAASNIGTSFYLRNPQTGSYTTVPVSANYTIPGSTAFFIKANAATSLTFTETNKTTCTSCATLFRNSRVQNSMQIKAMQNGLEYDNLYLNMGKFSSTYDETTDAVKLTNDALNMYVLSSDNKRIASDFRSIENNDIIPLGISLATAYGVQDYDLKVSDFNMDGQTSLKLHDKLNNTYTDLKENTVYHLQVDPSNPSSIGDNRLEIIVAKQALPTTIGNLSSTNEVDIYATTDAIVLTNKTNGNIQNATVAILNMNGQNILSQAVNLSTGARTSIPVKQLSSGIYAVQLTMPEGRTTKKVLKP